MDVYFGSIYGKNLKGINQKSQKNGISHTVLWTTGSFDMQTCSIDQEQQYGYRDNALQQGLFPLRGFINKHGEPLITTRTYQIYDKVLLKYYQRKLLTSEHKTLFIRATKYKIIYVCFLSSSLFIITHRYR